METHHQTWHLRIFVDRCPVEVFAQNGEIYGAALIFPSTQSRAVTFVGDGARITKNTIYPLIFL